MKPLIRHLDTLAIYLKVWIFVRNVPMSFGTMPIKVVNQEVKLKIYDPTVTGGLPDKLTKPDKEYNCNDLNKLPTHLMSL